VPGAERGIGLGHARQRWGIARGIDARIRALGRGWRRSGLGSAAGEQGNDHDDSVHARPYGALAIRAARFVDYRRSNRTTFVALIFVALAGCNSPAKSKPAPLSRAEDRVEVLARHLPAAGKEDLDADPVIVHFDRFAVTKASFNPANLEGGTATIELDPTSIKTGNTERDDDLKSPAYLEVAKFATITIDVANVKKQTATRYTADASVACHGLTKTYPVTFDVVTATANAVRIKGEYTFSRVDFAVGVDPATDPTERIAAPLTIQWVLTLENS
jgi:polyisoprenoid-binding protein YceI